VNQPVSNYPHLESHNGCESEAADYVLQEVLAEHFGLKVFAEVDTHVVAAKPDAPGLVAGVNQKGNEGRDTDVGSEDGEGLVELEKPGKENGEHHVETPEGRDAEENAYGHAPGFDGRGFVAADEVDFEQGAPVVADDVAHKIAGFDVDDGPENEQGVEHADAGEIAEGAEVGDALGSRRVINFYGNGYDIDAAPCPADDDLDFEFVFAGEEADGRQRTDGIEAVAGLCVGKADVGFEVEPEVGKLISEAALAGHGALLHVARTDDDGAGVFLQRIEHHRQVIGKMLSVRVERDGIVVAIVAREFKTLSESPALADILGIGMQFYLGELRKDVERIIGGPVIDYANIIGVLKHIAEHLRNGRAVVVGGNEDAAAQRLELVLINFFIHQCISPLNLKNVSSGLL
jgi:hypothetical protein